MLPLRLKPTDYFNHTVSGSDGTYLYQFDNSALNRIPLNDRGNPEQLTTFAAMPETPSGLAFIILSTGTMLCVGTSFMIMRSVDGGATWVDTGTTMDHSPSGWNKGQAEITVNGSKRVYFGEYNTSGSGTVKLYESTDDGATFSVLNTWTYDSGAQHLHCVLADPYNPTHLYLGFGDADAFTGVLKWDSSVGDWADIGDKSCATIKAASIAGFTAQANTTVGSQRYRTTDIVFTPNYLYSYADASITGSLNSGTIGIWAFDRNLENWRNVNSDSIDYTTIGGISGCYANGQALLTGYVSTASGVDNELPVFGIRDGQNCKKIGVIHTQDIAATKGIRSMFAVGNEAFISLSPQGGKGTQKGTCSFTVTDEVFLNPVPDILHPVYWVDPTGADTNDGETPRAAYQTVGKVLAVTVDADVIPWGSCVMLGANDYAEAGFQYGSWNTFAGSFDTEAGKRVQVRGEGKANTAITLTGTNGLTEGGAFAVDHIFHLSDLTLTSVSTGGSTLLGNIINYSDLFITDSDIGDPAVQLASAVYVHNATVKAYRSKISLAVLTGDYAVRVIDTGVTCKFESYGSILAGGGFTIDMNNDGAIELSNSVVKDATTAGVITRAGLTTQPIIVSCAFHSDEVAWTPLDDDNAMTYTAIDYCIMSGISDGTADAEYGANSIIDANVGVTGDVYTDPANDDYTPVIANPVAYKKGGSRPLTGTYSGGLFNVPATIGCDDTELTKRPVRSR